MPLPGENGATTSVLIFSSLGPLMWRDVTCCFKRIAMSNVSGALFIPFSSKYMLDLIVISLFLRRPPSLGPVTKPDVTCQFKNELWNPVEFKGRELSYSADTSHYPVSGKGCGVRRSKEEEDFGRKSLLN